MLLLNLVRAVIFLIAMLLGHTFQLAYGIEGVPMILVATAIAFAAFFLADAAEAGLLAYFNPDETKA